MRVVVFVLTFLSGLTLSFAAVKAPSGQTSGAVKPSVETSKKNPWKTSWKTELTAPVDNVSENEGEVSLVNQLTVAYRWSGLRFAVKPSVIAEYTIENGRVKHTVGNTILEVKKSQFLSLGRSQFDGEISFYAPTGEKFRRRGTRGVFGAAIEWSAPLGSAFKIDYEVNPRYYFQTERSRVDFDEYGRILNRPRSNRSFLIKNSLGAKWKPFKNLSLFQKVGLEHGWVYTDPELDLTESNLDTEFKLQTGITYKIKPFEFKFSFKQNHDIEDDNEFFFYGYEETSYYFEMVVGL